MAADTNGREQNGDGTGNADLGDTFVGGRFFLKRRRNLLRVRSFEKSRKDSGNDDARTEAAGVSHQVHTGAQAVKEIVGEKNPKTFELFLDGFNFQRSFLEREIRYESTGDSEDCATGSGGGDLRMNGEAEQSSEKSGGEIEEQKCGAAHETFREAAQRKQTPHVQGQMNDSEVEKHGSDQTPPLSAEGQRTIIGAEASGEVDGHGVKPRAFNEFKYKNRGANGDEPIGGNRASGSDAIYFRRELRGFRAALTASSRSGFQTFRGAFGTFKRLSTFGEITAAEMAFKLFAAHFTGEQDSLLIFRQVWRGLTMEYMR